MRLPTVPAMLVAAVWTVLAPAAAVSGARNIALDMAQQMREMAALSETDRQDMRASGQQRSGACPAGPAGNHSLEPPDTCTAEHYLHWKSHIEQCSCQPREAVVSLQDMPTFNIIQPSVVVANRCSGWCSTMGQTCMATETGEKAVTIFHYDVSGRLQCGKVRVQEHHECRCGCPLTTADCNEQQEFRSDLCMCRCKKSAAWRNCGARRHWDSRQCRCVCKEHDECSTGFGWSNEYCRCLRMMMPPVGEESPSTDGGSARAGGGNTIYT